jgi:hypothetical protein
MRKIAKYFALMVMGVGTLLLGSCHGQADEPIEEPTDPKTEVPDGVLRIFADKGEIAADGSDLVTFTVMFGKEDVSEAKTLQLVRTYEGKDTYMPYGVNTFSSVVPATYTFRAEYYYSGKHYTDNSVVVTVRPVSEGGGQTKNFVQKILGLQFTSTGCVNCPTLSTNLKAIQGQMPGKLSVVSFHQNFNNIDEMTHPMTAAYYKQIKRQGLPQFNANLIINDEYITVKVVADKNPDFKDPIDLQLGKKNRLFELDPVQILPEETEKTIQIRLNPKAMERYKKNKKSKPNWQMYISGIVKGEWVKQGKGRQVQIAKYNEMTPIFVIQLKR